jgi:hypothetical protein
VVGEGHRVDERLELVGGDGAEAGRRHIDGAVLVRFLESLDRHCGRRAPAGSHEVTGELAGRGHPLVLHPRRVGHVPALGEHHVVADRVPPEHPRAKPGQHRLVDILPDLAAGHCRCLHQCVEIEQERLIENGNQGDLVGKLVGRRHADVDGAAGHGVHHLLVLEELGLVEDLDGNGALGQLLQLRLEALEIAAEDRVGERKLQIGLQLELLGGHLMNRDQC